MLIGSRRPTQLRQLDVERRHAGQTGDMLALDRIEHIARQQIVQEHHRRAAMESGCQLAESGIKGQGQGGQQDVVRPVLQIAGNALGPGDQIAVRQHHALGLAGAARGIENRRDVGVDQSRAADWLCIEQLAPAQQLDAGECGHRLGFIGHDDMAQCRA